MSLHTEVTPQNPHFEQQTLRGHCETVAPVPQSSIEEAVALQFEMQPGIAQKDVVKPH